MNALNLLELPILDWIVEHLHCAFLDFVMPLVTALGDHGIFWIAVAVILLFFKKTRKLGFVLGGAFLLGLLTGNVLLKNLTARIRPYDLAEAKITIEHLLVSALSDYSFPSGHTLVCTEAAVVLLCLARKPWGYLASVAAVAVMFSRLYLYVHYPTDVLAGAILGTICALVSVRLVPMLYDKAVNAIAKRRAS